MYALRPPLIARLLWPRALWRVRTVAREVFLTFDDGPQPGVTDEVLHQLHSHHAKATFFCLGKNALQLPDFVARIRQDGHGLGHHTFGHSNGWRTSLNDYLNDVEKGAAAIPSPLFRPPYGRIGLRQARQVQKKYRIVMWSMLSGDYDARLSKEQCLAHVLRHIGPGSIIVFHDNEKSKEKMLWVLERTLQWLQSEGYTCRALPYEHV